MKEDAICFIVAKLGCATEREARLIAAFVHGLDIVGWNPEPCIEILAPFVVAIREAKQKAQAEEVQNNE